MDVAAYYRVTHSTISKSMCNGIANIYMYPPYISSIYIEQKNGYAISHRAKRRAKIFGNRPTNNPGAN